MNPCYSFSDIDTVPADTLSGTDTIPDTDSDSVPDTEQLNSAYSEQNQDNYNFR